MTHLLPLVLLALLGPGSDVRLDGVRLDAFLKSKGTTELGKDVRWTVQATAFSLPAVTRRGYSLYVYKGIGLVVAADSSALEEARRRGGKVVVRGKVQAAPETAQKDLRLKSWILVRELTSRPEKK